MSRYRTIKPEDVEVGMTIRLTESYPSGTRVTYEGEVTGVSSNTVDFANACAYRSSVSEIVVEPIEQLMPELPTAAGAVVLAYDPLVMRDRAAVLNRLMNASGPSRLAWLWADNGTEVDDQLLVAATILFDGGP